MVGRGGLRTLLLAATLSACSAESGSPSPASPGNESFEPVPPAEILFRLERRDEQLEPILPRLTLYADGRLLSWDPARDDLLVRTLSETGIDAFLAEVLASGFFAESHPVAAELLPGQEPPDPFVMGIGFDRFLISPAGGPTIEVTTVTTDDPGLFANSPERDALVALADRLIAADWLAAESWFDATPTRYVADAYLLLSGSTNFPPEMPICPGEAGTPTCARDVATVAWPVALPPDGFGPPFRSADGLETGYHCAVVGHAFAAALAAAMQPGPGGGLSGHLYVTTSIAWRERNAFYELRLRPLLPEESATCAGKVLFPVEGPII